MAIELSKGRKLENKRLMSLSKTIDSLQIANATPWRFVSQGFVTSLVGASEKIKSPR